MALSRRRDATSLALIIVSMAGGNSALPRSCDWCGGKGWKWLTLRRSVARRDSSEQTVRRQRTTCLGCGGSGSASRAGDAW
jgi:hypothetical protein